MSADLASMTLAEAEAWRAGWRAAIEAAASKIDCGCALARKAKAIGKSPNGEDQWLACPEENCPAIDVASIRAMEPPA